MLLISLVLRSASALEFVRPPRYPKIHMGVSKVMHPEHCVNFALQKISRKLSYITLLSL